MMEDIIDLPYAIKQAHDAKPSDTHQILLLNMKDIFLLDNILKTAEKNLLKHDINKFISCAYDTESDILSIEFE